MPLNYVMETRIKLLHNKDIDLERWDRLVAGAINSRVYAESWYLDIINSDWHGLIYDDYSYVMPIIPAEKWGVKYLFQPTYAQQHGIFPPATPAVSKRIFDYLIQHYRFVDISLNSMNVLSDSVFKVEERKNFILSLKPEYDEIRSGYSSHNKRYSNKAAKICDVSTHVNLDEYIKLKVNFGQSVFTEANKAKLKLIIYKALNRGEGKIYGAFNKRNELVAAAFFLFEKKRITYLNSVSGDDGKELRAMYAIVDVVIKEYAGRNYLLDFEGSNIEGIARFFAGFGALPETYQHIKYNNLPWYMKMFKK